MASRRRQIGREQELARQKSQRRTIYLIGGVVGAIILILIGIFAFRSPAPTSVGGGAQCSDVSLLPSEGQGHIKPGETPTYNTVPPTSGSHNPDPLPSGIYDDQQDVTRTTHSLEHGYVIINYNGLSQPEIEQLKNIVNQDSRKIILAPYPNMPHKLALTSWTRMQTCDGVNEQVIRNFMQQFRDQAPEPFGARN